MRLFHRWALIVICLLLLISPFSAPFACVQCSILTGELKALVAFINQVMGGNKYKDHRDILAKFQKDYNAQIGSLQRDLAQIQAERDEKVKALSAAQAKLVAKTEEATKVQTDLTRLAQQLEALQKEKQQLEATLRTEQAAKTKTAEAQTASLQTITQLQEKLATAEARIKALTQELQQREKDLAATTKAQALLQAQMQALADELKTARASIAHLESTLHAAETAQQEALTLRLAAEKAHQEEMTRRATAEEQTKKMEAERKRLVAQLAVLKLKIAQEEGQLRREIERLTKESTKAEQLLKAEKVSHEQTRSALAALQRMEADLRKTLLEHTTENSRLAVAHTAAQSMAAQLTHDLAAAQEKIEALAEEERNLRAKIRSLEDALRAKQTAPFEMPASLKSKLSSLERDLDQKDHTIRSLQQELSILRMGQAVPSTPKSPGRASPFKERSLSRAASTSSPHPTPEVVRLTAELDDVTLELERTLQDFQAETTRATRLERALEVAQEKAALWEAAQKETEAEVEHWRDQFQAAHQLSTRYEEELQTIARRLEESEKSNRRLQAQLSTRTHTLTDTEEEKALVAAELEQLNLEHQKLRRDYERLATQIVTLEKEAEEGRLDMTALEEEYRFYQSKYAHDHALLCKLQSTLLEDDSEEATRTLLAIGLSPPESRSRAPSPSSAEDVSAFL